MKKLAIIGIFFSLLFLINTTSVFATIGIGVDCKISEQNGTDEAKKCDTNLFCKVKDQARPDDGKCQKAQIQVTTPEKGFTTLGNFISNALTIAFAAAVLVVLVMLILGAFEWITSGGDKEAVGKARNRIINALIGLLVLAVAFALARVVGQFVGLDLNNLTIPAPDRNATGL